MSARFTAVHPPQARGMIFIHSASAALCPHIEWAIGATIGCRAKLSWTGQPVQPGTRRCELSWNAPVGSGAMLATKLANFGKLRFEITEEATARSDGMRYSYTPALGSFSAVIGVHGDILVGEDRIRRAIADDALGTKDLAEVLPQLLGKPWDDELEVFRHASEDTPVRWLHEVG